MCQALGYRTSIIIKYSIGRHMHEGDNNSSFLSNDLKKKFFKKKNQTKCCYSHDVKNKTKKKI